MYSGGGDAASNVAMIIMVLIYGVTILFSLAVAIVMIVSYWKLFTKAGRPGWAAIIPFYSNYVMSEIEFGNGLWFLLLFVPVVNTILAYYMMVKFPYVYGKGAGFMVLTFFFPYVMFPILAFGDSEYDASRARLF